MASSCGVGVSFGPVLLRSVTVTSAVEEMVDGVTRVKYAQQKEKSDILINGTTVLPLSDRVGDSPRRPPWGQQDDLSAAHGSRDS